MSYFLIKYCSNFFINIIVGFLNLFIRRSNKVILVGAWMGEKFTDNSRYLYQYLHFNKQELGLARVIWVTRNDAQHLELLSKGYECYKMKSLKSMYYHIKSGVHIVCNVPHGTRTYKGDILGELSLGAKKIQLWHGIPLKGVGNTISVDRSGMSKIRKISLFLKRSYLFKHFIHASGGWDDFLLLSTSVDVSQRFEKIFNIDAKKIIESSYPRNCECLDYLKREEQVIDIIKKKYTILYLPTFRDKKVDFTYPLELKGIKDILEKYPITWIQKAHSADNHLKKIVQNSDSKNLILEPEFDINTILPTVDLIITDYSSVSFDGIYYDKKIIYYIPDFDYYVSSERGLSSDFDKNIAGRKVLDERELIEAIVDAFHNRTQDAREKSKMKKVKNLVFDNRKAVYKEIIERLSLDI